MSAQLAPKAGAQWLRWFPAPAEDRTHRWRLMRFESVSDAGQPIGKAITAMTPGNDPRLFQTEASATRCAVVLNEQDGL
jgi:hypothetical protein